MFPAKSQFAYSAEEACRQDSFLFGSISIVVLAAVSAAVVSLILLRVLAGVFRTVTAVLRGIVFHIPVIIVVFHCHTS